MARSFDDWFKEFSSWGLSRDELIQALFASGSDDGDTIYVTRTGSEMTRYMGQRWLNFYDAASAGWNAAIAELSKPTTL